MIVSEIFASLCTRHQMDSKLAQGLRRGKISCRREIGYLRSTAAEVFSELQLESTMNRCGAIGYLPHQAIQASRCILVVVMHKLNSD